MNRTEQHKMNCEVLYHLDKAVDEMNAMRDIKKPKRLRSCTAWVYETQHYYILCSYNTLIACINKCNDCLYDALRHEYGFTRTSAQHISKFDHEYGRAKWGCADRMTSRSI